MGSSGECHDDRRHWKGKLMQEALPEEGIRAKLGRPGGGVPHGGEVLGQGRGVPSAPACGKVQRAAVPKKLEPGLDPTM